MDLTIDEKLYLEAKKYIRECKEENRGDLYYTLLDWCDSHLDKLKNSLFKKTDVYIITYRDKDGTIHTERFAYKDEFYNPYMDSVNRWNELVIDGNPYVILYINRNPYLVPEGSESQTIYSHIV